MGIKSINLRRADFKDTLKIRLRHQASPFCQTFIVVIQQLRYNLAAGPKHDDLEVLFWIEIRQVWGTVSGINSFSL